MKATLNPIETYPLVSPDLQALALRLISQAGLGAALPVESQARLERLVQLALNRGGMHILRRPGRYLHCRVCGAPYRADSHPDPDFWARHDLCRACEPFLARAAP